MSNIFIFLNFSDELDWDQNETKNIAGEIVVCFLDLHGLINQITLQNIMRSFEKEWRKSLSQRLKACFSCPPSRYFWSRHCTAWSPLCDPCSVDSASVVIERWPCCNTGIFIWLKSALFEFSVSLSGCSALSLVWNRLKNYLDRLSLPTLRQKHAFVT